MNEYYEIGKFIHEQILKTKKETTMKEQKPVSLAQSEKMKRANFLRNNSRKTKSELKSMLADTREEYEAANKALNQVIREREDLKNESEIQLKHIYSLENQIKHLDHRNITLSVECGVMKAEINTLVTNRIKLLTDKGIAMSPQTSRNVQN